MEELLWETSISSFVDSRWLLYTQSVISVGNTADMEIRVTLDAVKRVKVVIIMGCFTEQNSAENYPRSFSPS